MIDVAKMANVATMTVSRVLNKPSSVSVSTSNKVHAAIERLGYQPNEMARILRGFKSKTIGLIVPSLADPFFATCAHSINRVAQGRGYSMILSASNDREETELTEARWMLQKNVDGLLLCPAGTGAHFADAAFQRTPMVSFDRPLALQRVPRVLVENYAGSRKGTEHLIQKHGHERIHFLGDSQELYPIQTRWKGYKKAVSEANLIPQATLDCRSEEVIHEKVGRLLAGKDAPTAFFCGNNMVSRGLIRSLRRLGVRIPHDLAVVGFDDLELADLLTPALTVVRQPMEDLGANAAYVLFDLLGTPFEEWPVKGALTTLKVDLIIRQSCGC